jgi:hypothetical protein
MLNILVFSQAFFRLFPGLVPIVRSFAVSIDRETLEPTDDAAATVQKNYAVGTGVQTGQIVVSPKLPVLTCRVVDYSAGGACLDIYGLGAVPDRFEFHYGGVKKKSRIVWRRGIRIGVAF